MAYASPTKCWCRCPEISSIEWAQPSSRLPEEDGSVATIASAVDLGSQSNGRFSQSGGPSFRTYIPPEENGPFTPLELGFHSVPSYRPKGCGARIRTPWSSLCGVGLRRKHRHQLLLYCCVRGSLFHDVQAALA
jgi:hypothetical protein